METIDAFIFVQGFVWGALLLKKRLAGQFWLGLSFLVSGIFFFLDYTESLYQMQIPLSLTYGFIILLILSTTYYLYKNLSFNETTKLLVPYGLVALFFLLLLYQGFIIPGNRKSALLMAGVAGIFLCFADTFFLLRRIQKKTHTSNILDIANYRLPIYLMVLKGLFVWIILLQDQSTSGHLILQILFALMLFFTGHSAVQYSYEKKPARKTRGLKHIPPDSGRNLIRLMEEKKPYLDCELTLAKVAAMLDMTENELTGLLHTGMQTSFYDLINSYRVQAVKEQLLQADAKKYTIMSAAFESGFNSRSTFYRIFKAYTGMQPGEFMTKGLSK